AHAHREALPSMKRLPATQQHSWNLGRGFRSELPRVGRRASDGSPRRANVWGFRRRSTERCASTGQSGNGLSQLRPFSSPGRISGALKSRKNEIVSGHKAAGDLANADEYGSARNTMTVTPFSNRAGA